MDTPILNKVNIVKVGGAVVEDEQMLTALLQKFAAIEGPKVLVHGGGRSATKMAAQLGIETHMVEGRRVTDEEMLRVVQMVYGGLVNKSLVARLQALGVNAIGLTGADMNLIRAHKRPLKKVRFEDGHEEMVDYGWVGDVDGVDGEALASLIRHTPLAVPVVAPLTHDGMGHLLNTNADTIAAETVSAGTAYPARCRRRQQRHPRHLRGIVRHVEKRGCRERRHATETGKCLRKPQGRSERSGHYPLE